MIKAIIFDCFGVLTADTWKEFVATLPQKQHQAARELNQAYGAALITKSEFLQGIKKLTNRQPVDIDNAIDNDHGITKNTQLLDYIATLKKEYKISLLSNVGSNWIRQSFLTPSEQALFDDFVFSYEAHMVKPDPQIFKLAAEKLGVALEDCVLVDDIERYCQAACEQGMQAVYYQDFRQMRTELEKLLAGS